ncbi:MAG TPA: hypothetical protein VFV78_11515 [Vicinamibacterales bacterium]|nr:hypothetical protein [Vicinamibacterales bacterium]
MRQAPIALLALLVFVCGAAPVSSRTALASLTNDEFWSMVQDMSEPGGAFHSDNFTSNEPNFAQVAATLDKSGPHGGAYLGVGPEQNFHYIAAIRPAIAIIFDIRRQAIVQHLLFKALFELSADRADFIARLFSLPRPAGVDRATSIVTMWDRFGQTPSTDREALAGNIADVESLLTKTHGFGLSEDDKKSLAYVYEAFFRLGPSITYAGDRPGLTTGNTNFTKLTALTDAEGVPRSFLGTDETFQYLKLIESRNLVVPIQADFGGPKSIRAVGDFLRAQHISVSAFYISNVEQYLFRPEIGAAPGGRELNGGWKAFYDNLTTLPATDATVLLRVPISSSQAMMIRRTLPDGTTRMEPRTLIPLCNLKAFLADVDAGKIKTQSDANACGR